MPFLLVVPLPVPATFWVVFTPLRPRMFPLRGSTLGCVRADPSSYVPSSSSGSGQTCNRVLAIVPPKDMSKPVRSPPGIGIDVTVDGGGVRAGVHRVVHGADVAQRAVALVRSEVRCWKHLLFVEAEARQRGINQLDSEP